MPITECPSDVSIFANAAVCLCDLYIITPTSSLPCKATDSCPDSGALLLFHCRARGQLQFLAVPELNQPTKSTEARPRDFHLETAERPHVPPRAPFTLLSCPLSCAVVLSSVLVTTALSLKPINGLDALIALKELIQVKDLQVIAILKQADRGISKLGNPCCLRGANAASLVAP